MVRGVHGSVVLDLVDRRLLDDERLLWVLDLRLLALAAVVVRDLFLVVPELRLIESANVERDFFLAPITLGAVVVVVVVLVVVFCLFSGGRSSFSRTISFRFRFSCSSRSSAFRPVSFILSTSIR